MNHVLPHIEGYIWQRDRFSLRLGATQRPPWQRGKEDAPPPTLWGSVAFGDNVEDEWFIVWLLLDITRQFKHVTARCVLLRRAWPMLYSAALPH